MQLTLQPDRSFSVVRMMKSLSGEIWWLSQLDCLGIMVWSSAFHRVLAKPQARVMRAASLPSSSLNLTFLTAAKKFLPPAGRRRETVIKQGRQTTRLSLWRKCLDKNNLYKGYHLPSPAYRHAMTRRAQCFVAAINMATVLFPYETEYDRHAATF
jgi:hypothetical protein